MRRLVLLLVALSATACGVTGAPVMRVVDGRPLLGPFVAPEAYEFFLRGAIEEESGDYEAAARTFEQTADLDPDDALVWTKLAESLCRGNVHDARVRKALRRARSIDAAFAPARALAIECLGEPVEDAAVVLRDEPRDVNLSLSMERALARAGAEGDARARLLALALARPRPAAWAALLEWGKAHADDSLAQRASEELARSSGGYAAPLSTRAKELAGDGALGPARSLAAAIVDGPSVGAVDPLVARLAVDEALSREGRDDALRRAGRAHIPLPEVAARALLLGRPELARGVAELVLSAEPANLSARLVTASVGASTDDALGVRRALSAVKDGVSPSAPALLVFLQAVSRASGEVSAAPAFSVLDVSGADALLVPVAVDLAARGLIPASSLPVEGRIELALRNDDTGALATLAAGADRRHRLAALASTTGVVPPALAELASELSARSPSDPLVRAAALRLLARSARGDRRLLQGALDLLALDPSDPVALASALAVLSRSPSSPLALARAKARMAAVAVTPHERGLAY